MDALLQDLRHAWRGVRRRPLFAFIAILSLAIGTGATTAVFSAVNTLLLAPAPGIAEPDRVVEIGRGRDGSGFDSFSYPDFLALREQAAPLTDMAIYDVEPASFRAQGAGFQILAADVSAAYFRALGVTPAMGRLFRDDEDAPWGAHPVAVVDHAFWRDRLGADPDVLGRTITVNRMALTVVGVLPQEFHGHVIALRPNIYLPVSMVGVLKPDFASTIEHPNSHWMSPIARLAEGATLEQAQAAAATVFDRLRAESPRLYEHKTVGIQPYGVVPAPGRGPVRVFMGILLTLVGLVLLVTCANVAGMLLVHAAGREKELAVRSALGAGRSALVRQLLVEALALFVVGGALGTLLAYWLTGLASAVSLPAPIPLDLSLRPDVRVLVFALAATLTTGTVFGLLPALPASRPQLVPALKDGARSGGRRGGRLRRIFVVAQVALSLVLLVAAGLFLRSLQGAGAIAAGFDPDNVYLASMNLQLEGYDEAEGGRLVDALLERARAIPGVTTTAASRDLPMDLASWGIPYWEEGTWDGGDRKPYIGSEINVVSPGYFQTLGIALLQGRTFTAADDADAEPAVVVSRALAEEAWPGEPALGRHLKFDDGTETVYSVVGVVEDTKNQLLTEVTEPMAYRSYAQAYVPEVNVLVKAAPGVGGIPAALRGAILELDPEIALAPVRSLDETTSIGIMPQRIAAWLASVLGALALFLSGLGIYGVVAYTFARRTREVGIRVAVGARRGDIVGLVLRYAGGLILPGLVLGGAAGVGIAFLVRSLLIGVQPLDLATFGAVAGLLAAVVLAAVAVPARRAVAVHPMEALRSE